MLKYEMIAQEINEYIEKEHYEAGDKLPNVEKFKEICDKSFREFGKKGYYISN